MVTKKGSYSKNRMLLRFFRNLTKGSEVLRFKTKTGYIFFARVENSDLVLWIDRTSNTISLNVADARPPRPSLH